MFSISESEPTVKGGHEVVAPDFDESPVAAFERVAATFPSRIALGSDVWEPTYRELNETANRLAHRLIACGVASGDRVAILMSHDAPLVGAVLGILKTGSIVVVLDPGDPVSRLKMLIEDAEPSVIVTDVQNQNLAAEFGHAGCSILNFESETVMGPVQNPSIEIQPEQTAFLTYTSGTTGRPKGVMRPHRQLRRAAAAYSDAIHYTGNDRVPLFAMVSTGQGSVCLWWTLLNGAMLCPFSLKTRGIAGLADWIIVSGLTVYVSSASIFRTLVKTIDDRLVFANVRAVQLMSEPATADDFRAFRQHFPRTSIFVHTLSSSETSNIAWSRWTQDDDIPEGALPVGHFSRDMDVSLLGDDGQPVARGDVGEIVVKSRYLANGYWRDPKLTAERFSADLDGNGTRLLRTGDRGRINADGLLEFYGREDSRIKIRGNRIELLDIERALGGIPGIDRVAVVGVVRDGHEPLLVAFVVKKDDASLTAPRVKRALRSNLPLHMVPSRIVFLDSLPYNRGNKVDREALRQYSLPVRDGDKVDEPRTETEMLLADIWAEILELPDISRDDDFFNLGGDSLSGAIVAAQVYAALGVELSLGAIADHPTVSTLAAFIDESRRMGAPKTSPVVRVPRAATMPMSLFQEALWNHCRRQEDRAHFTHVRSYRVIGPLDIEILKECLSYLIGRHEILRTTFGLVEGCTVQTIHQSAPLALSFVDLIDADDPEAQAGSIIRKESSRGIDLEKLPIRRNVLIRIANNNYRLVCITHPLITDGTASQILDAELATLYEAMLHGKEPPLPKEPPLQYADYAVWQRQVMRPDGPYFNEVMSWWKGLSIAPRAPRLPFRRLIRRAPLDPNEGVLQWKLAEQAAKQLDAIARSAGATFVTVRLAAFAALIADVTANSTIAIGASFANRNRVETQNIVGPFLNVVHLVFSYDANKTFLQWLEFVRDQVFEATTRAELPYDSLRASGVQPPEIEFYFTMTIDHSDQRFGNLAISDEFYSVGTMPRRFMLEVDERKPENCRVNFDADAYDRNEMRVMLDRYLRLLEAAAREPELPLRKLLAMIGAKPLRWTCANYAAPFYEFATTFYASSPLLKMCWKPIRRWVLSGD
jgi:amino acid adenylation domain-containing protein